MRTQGAILLSLSEATELGFGAYSTLRKHIAEGRLPAVKIGSRVKVRREDLDGLAVPKHATVFEAIEAAAERIAAAAPPLTDTQVRRLVAIFGGA